MGIFKKIFHRHSYKTSEKINEVADPDIYKDDDFVFKVKTYKCNICGKIWKERGLGFTTTIEDFLSYKHQKKRD